MRIKQAVLRCRASQKSPRGGVSRPAQETSRSVRSACPYHEEAAWRHYRAHWADNRHAAALALRPLAIKPRKRVGAPEEHS
eukprot:scaffold974_cov368-Prasinococcus_capsulatus_cf.AAC.7